MAQENGRTETTKQVNTGAGFVVLQDRLLGVGTYPLAEASPLQFEHRIAGMIEGLEIKLERRGNQRSLSRLSKKSQEEKTPFVVSKCAGAGKQKKVKLCRSLRLKEARGTRTEKDGP